MAVKHPSKVMAHGTPRLWNCIIHQHVSFTEAASIAVCKRKKLTIGIANIGNPAPSPDRKKQFAAIAELALML